MRMTFYVMDKPFFHEFITSGQPVSINLLSLRDPDKIVGATRHSLDGGHIGMDEFY
ncbi:MAG: hypothetical protein JRI95_14380 [Deltaproteobacteria bacterium]|nr:hypothetical protein [Deltaproteobacteria bacterium]